MTTADTKPIWALGVLALPDGDRWATLTIEPADEPTHAELAVRLRSAGMKKLNRRDWDGGLWPQSRCSVTHTDGRVTQLHTGRSRILSADPLPVSAAWAQAAQRGRIVLCLAQPGAFLPGDVALGAVPDEEATALADRFVNQPMLGGLATVRTDPEPYGRRW